MANIKIGTRMTLTEALETDNTPTMPIRLSLSDALKFEEENPKPQPLTPAGKVLEVLKGVPRGFENIASGVGATVQWLGEIITETDEDYTQYTIHGKPIQESKMGKTIARWGNTAYDFWKEEAQRGIEAADPNIFRGSFMQNPSWVRGVATVAEAIPSLATATVVTFATGNPIAGAASLGLLEGSGQYIEARQADKSVGFSSGVGLLSTVGNTILEIIPLTRFLRGGAGKLPKDIFVGAIQEGTEEVLQALWTNMIARIGYDKTRDLTQGMVEGFIGGAGSGGMIGGITSGRGIKTDTLVKEALVRGATPEQIETMQEAVKEQIVSKADEINEVLETTEAPTMPKIAKIEERIAPKAPEAIVDIAPEEKVVEKAILEEIPSKEIVAEKIARNEELTPIEKEAFPDLAELEKKILFLREKESLTESEQKRLDDLLGQVGVEPGEKIKRAPPARKIVGEEPAEFVRARETTILKRRIQDIAKGARIGTITTKQQIKQVQTELIETIEKSGIEAKDKAKFIKTIKNIQTKEQLAEALPDIIDTVTRLKIAAEKRWISAKITKELKTTKPLKKGQKRVGKYDYEGNKTFDNIRRINKLTQSKAQVELDAIPEEGLSYTDLVKARMLSLKANGASASTELHNQVLNDILAMKQAGSEAKNEADFQKRMERQEKVDSALSAIDKIKADKKTIKTKIGNIYRQGFSNIYSMMNSIFGKEFAEQYDPEIKENARDTAVFLKIQSMTKEVSRTYDEKNAFKALETLARKDYKITDIEGLTIELSKLDLIDIYNSLKNDLGRKRYDNAFGKEQVDVLMGELSQADTLFGDFLQKTVQGYRPIYNKRNIEITGRDAGLVENYWPFTSEFQVDVFDDIRIQGETPKALKERAKSSKIIPVPRNAWLKAQKHIAQGEHLDNLSREYETLKRLFSDRKVKHSIKEKFGDNVYNVLINQIDNISLNAQTKKVDAVSKWFGYAINNWVTAKIALNPSTYIRQLMSVGNYIENMDSTAWANGFLEGISNPKKTFDFMWKNAPFLEARFNRGYSEALKNAIDGAEKLSVNWGSYTKFLSSLARSGDITAIVYGGFPLVQAELAKHGNTKRAIEVFEKSTLKSQQSGLSSSISQFQNSRNPFARLFLAFKNTSNQYFRKMADAIISRANGDISNTQFAKTMTIYAVIQPIMYASSGFLLRQAIKSLGDLIFDREGEDREESMQKLFLAIMTQLAVAPVNAIPIIDDIMTFSIRRLTGQKAWKVMSTPFLDDLAMGIQKLSKKEPTAEDYLKATSSILEPTTAAPINTFIRYYEYIIGKKSKRKGAPRI